MAHVTSGTSAATSTPTPTLAAPELLIDARPDLWVEYVGTAQQLEGEGLIPAAFEWPKARRSKFWNADGFAFWLRRTRPAGHTGRLGSWTSADSWFLRVTVQGRDWHWDQRRRVERKAMELAALIHSQSPQGEREHYERCARFFKARDDVAFQAFKAVVLPERKRPGRQKTTMDKVL